MKKIFAIFVAMLFVASLSFAVVGCKKSDDPRANAPKVQTPANAPVPGPGPAPAPEAGTPAPAPQNPPAN
jgi:hypothetical protein